MPRSLQDRIELQPFFAQLAMAGDDAPSIEQKLEIVSFIRAHTRGASRELDQFLVSEIERLRSGLAAAAGMQENFKKTLERLTEKPWHPAILLGVDSLGDTQVGTVAIGDSRRVVGFGEDVDPSELQAGDVVLLAHQQNVIVARAPGALPRAVETAQFERRLGDGRLALRSRDEQVIVAAAGSLDTASLASGDQLLWDRNARLALERVERPKGEGLFMEETPAEGFEAIGGLDRQVEELQRAITMHVAHRDHAARYELPHKRSVLLVGPPGTGKTMIARALANWLARSSATGRSRFMNVKPSGLHSMWYGQSEANYREAFRVARQASADDADTPVVMFMDEVDAVGSSRGDSHMRVDDRVLTALMTELDGLERRGNVLVVAATNRRDALDPALLRPGRLGDLILEIGRPGQRAARAILEKHLGVRIPYAGEEPEYQGDELSLRDEIIGAAASRLYAPNGGNDVATITFRDGKRRTLVASDLLTGAHLARIAGSAKERACLREIETGARGVQLRDLLAAAAGELEQLGAMLTPQNCRRHVSDLPHDMDVVRVEPSRPRVRAPHRYLSVA